MALGTLLACNEACQQPAVVVARDDGVYTRHCNSLSLPWEFLLAAAASFALTVRFGSRIWHERYIHPRRNAPLAYGCDHAKGWSMMTPGETGVMNEGCGSLGWAPINRWLPIVSERCVVVASTQTVGKRTLSHAEFESDRNAFPFLFIQLAHKTAFQLRFYFYTPYTSVNISAQNAPKWGGVCVQTSPPVGQNIKERQNMKTFSGKGHSPCPQTSPQSPDHWPDSYVRWRDVPTVITVTNAEAYLNL